MDLTWKYIKPLKDEKDFDEFLETYKVNLPLSLIRIMKEYNGGRPSDKKIITETKREYVFKSLLSFNKEDKETIYSIYPELFKNTDWFPFASDAAGNFICYDLKTKKIVLYNHESDSAETVVKFPLAV